MAMEQLYSGEAERSEQPLKLFVGQVPKDMDEEQLRPLFEQAGPIAHIMVIRDRQTDAHRGCAFLTYQTREAGELAVEKFHNKVKLPNAHNPVQVRPADSQMGDDRAGPNSRLAPVDRENKLFVGMLPHDADDMTLTEVFSPFGEITEIYCMRNPDGTPKGCAFVKFATRAAAIAAIEALHEKRTMDGATRALVVKFADVKKAHQAKHWLMDQRGGASPLGGNGLRHGGSAAGYWQATAPPGPGGRDVYGGGSGKGRELYPGHYPYPSYGSHIGPNYPGAPSSHSYDYHGQHGPQHGHGHGPSRGSQGGYPPYSQSAPYNRHYRQVGERSLSPSSAGGDRSHAQTFGSPPGGPLPGGRDSRDMHHRGDPRENGDQGGGTRPQEGPPGANLFIYHLPNDLTDADLATAFAPFGHVISAKVFLDKRTGESKGFGFVSYDHPSEAEVAISEMNGFQIGSKRLKVQHKKVDHGDREQDRDGRGYSNHHGGVGRDMHHAPLHGGSGRLGGMGHSHHSGTSSPEMRGYHHGQDMRMISGSGDTRVIYAGPIPASSYEQGAPDDAPTGPFASRQQSMQSMHSNASSAGVGAGVGQGGSAVVNDPSGGSVPGLYHPEGEN